VRLCALEGAPSLGLVSRRHTTVVVVLVLAALVGSFGLMLDEATHSGDWPGWDEGWALIAFPLGIPVAVAAAIGVGRSALSATNVRLFVLVTAAIWLWGAAMFTVWFALGQ
jgi:hypothetical protein